MNYSKVIFLGGAPMLGKTTVANIIAQKLEYSCISTDDVGDAIKAVTPKDLHPSFHYMDGIDYREYYIHTNKMDLERDANCLHEALWPALQALFRKHSTWGTPTIIEGWALRPIYVSQLKCDMTGLYLLADESLMRKRIQVSRFCEGASNENVMLEKYLERNKWFNSLVQKQAENQGVKTLIVSDEMQPEDVADECMQILTSASETL